MIEGVIASLAVRNIKSDFRKIKILHFIKHNANAYAKGQVGVNLLHSKPCISLISAVGPSFQMKTVISK